MRFILIFLLTLNVAFSQQSAQGLHISCPADQFHTHEMLTADIFTQKIRVNNLPSSAFSVVYHNVPESVINVVESAFQIWNRILISHVPITTHVYWEELDRNVLASAGAEKVYKNFKNAPIREVWYPSALAEAISGENLNGTDPDIKLRINKNIRWDYSLSSSPAGPSGTAGPGTFDLLSVVLHEITHGIGFLSSFDSSEEKKLKWGIENLPLIFDKSILDAQNQELVNNRFYSNNSEALFNAVTNHLTYFKIDSGYYKTRKPILYTTIPFNQSASLSHLANTPENFDDPRDRLMLPGLVANAKNQYPGNGILAMLYQMGWPLNSYELYREYPLPEGFLPYIVYPNPANNHIILSTKTNTEFKNEAYSILDLWGREIKTGWMNNAETEINLAGLSSGKYILKISTFTLPFIKY